MVDTLPKAEVSIAQWLRDYCEQVHEPRFFPTENDVFVAVSSVLPNLDVVAKSAQALLDEMGIYVISQFGDERIAFVGSVDNEEIEAMLQKYSRADYSLIRKALGIQYLWIIKINEGLCHMRIDLFEAHVQFSSLVEKTECVIIDL